jgi:ankyrin repeat protein
MVKERRFAFLARSWEDALTRAVLDDDAARASQLLERRGAGGVMWAVFGSRKELNDDNWLHVAAFSNSVRTARVLLSRGLDVNGRNASSDTPLHVAAQYGSWETADLLIECKADISATNREGLTPLDVAIQHGNNKIAELLKLIERVSLG